MNTWTTFWVVMVITFMIRLHYEWRKDHER